MNQTGNLIVESPLAHVGIEPAAFGVRSTELQQPEPPGRPQQRNLSGYNSTALEGFSEAGCLLIANENFMCNDQRVPHGSTLSQCRFRLGNVPSGNKLLCRESTFSRKTIPCGTQDPAEMDNLEELESTAQEVLGRLKSRHLFQSQWDTAAFVIFLIFVGTVLLLFLLACMHCCCHCCCRCCCHQSSRSRKVRAKQETSMGVDNLALDP
ncbi:small integral membrane protein 22 isoform X2 [Rhinolophus sinicus]|uniref:small integral membrane protein 22 isoform X2 n=1 Tax=Rhinolophus sinicus TaxID=89399 RepID=UPI003D7A4074